MLEETKKILIIEDEIILATDLAQMLSKSGFEICGIANREEKIMKLIDETEPNLILCDIYLNRNISGIDIMKKIKLKYKVPVIYITAYSDKETIDKAKETKPVDYIIKPFNEKHVIKIVKSYFEFRDILKHKYE